MICDYCGKNHPDGIDKEMIENGHPYYIDNMPGSNGAFVLVYKDKFGVIKQYQKN